MRPRTGNVIVRIMACCVTALLLLFLWAAGPDAMCAAGERYSLGTIQEDEVLDIGGGQETKTAIGLYNIDGTVPVQVDMSVVDVPGGLDVRLVPRCNEARIVAAAESEHTVSLQVAPMNVHEDMPTCESPCTHAWWLPGRGYVCAVAVDILVRAPENRTAHGGTLTVSVIGSWKSSPVAIPQERELVYDVIVEPVDSDRTTRLSLLVISTVAVCLLIAVFAHRRVAKSPPL